MKNEKCVDFVICLDASGKQMYGFDTLKNKIISLPAEFIANAKEAGKNIDQFRIKIISFRDYSYDNDPMAESEFFSLPEQTDDFCAYVNCLEAKGGGDSPECVLEAIAFAIRSDWATDGTDRTQTVMVLTNSKPHEFETSAKNSRVPYPADIMPKDLDELKDWWHGKGERIGTFEPSLAKMIVPCAPKCEIWEEIATWQGCVVNLV